MCGYAHTPLVRNRRALLQQSRQSRPQLRDPCSCTSPSAAFPIQRVPPANRLRVCDVRIQYAIWGDAVRGIAFEPLLQRTRPVTTIGADASSLPSRSGRRSQHEGILQGGSAARTSQRPNEHAVRSGGRVPIKRAPADQRRAQLAAGCDDDLCRSFAMTAGRFAQAVSNCRPRGGCAP